MVQAWNPARKAASVTLSGNNLIATATAWATLTAAQQQAMRDVFGMGSGIDASAGTNVRATIVSVFTGKATTMAALTALTTTTTNRAVQLGFPALNDQEVKAARAWKA